MNKLYYIPIIVILSLISIGYASAIITFEQPTNSTSVGLNWNGAIDNYFFMFKPNTTGYVTNVTIQWDVLNGGTPYGLVRVCETTSAGAPTNVCFANSSILLEYLDLFI